MVNEEMYPVVLVLYTVLYHLSCTSYQGGRPEASHIQIKRMQKNLLILMFYVQPSVLLYSRFAEQHVFSCTRSLLPANVTTSPLHQTWFRPSLPHSRYPRKHTRSRISPVVCPYWHTQLLNFNKVQELFARFRQLRVNSGRWITFGFCHCSWLPTGSPPRTAVPYLGPYQFGGILGLMMSPNKTAALLALSFPRPLSSTLDHGRERHLHRRRYRRERRVPLPVHAPDGHPVLL